MSDSKITRKHLKEIQRKLKACRKWLHQTFEQPYTVEEMTKTLAYYLNAHLHYYSNLPGQVAEKQQRIFKIQDRLIADHSNRTRDLKIALATSSDKKSLLRSEIAKYDHPYLYYKQGQYYKNEFTMVIPHVIDMLAEGHSPYFEFVFDENLELKNRDVYDFFSDLYFLEFLRQELEDLDRGEFAEEQKASPEILRKKGKQSTYETFEQLFYEPKDAEITINVMKNLRLLDGEETFIDLGKNKKTMVILIDFLGKGRNGKLKPVNDNVMAHCLDIRFNLSVTPRFLRKVQENKELILKDIVCAWDEERIKASSK